MRLSSANHAFITGGASGMGLAIADALAAEGVAITIADIDGQQADAVASARTGSFQSVVLDVRDRAGWRDAKLAAERAFGPVDILVNNAGIGPDGKEFADLDPVAFDRLIAVDVTGVMNGITTFAGEMRARRAGHIVNNASIVGLVSGVPGMGPYTMAKAAVVAMSEILRAELAPYDVGVSVLCPGPVATNFRKTTERESGSVSRKAAPVERMTAATVGRLVAKAIAADEPYILTHPDFLPAFESKAFAIREAFLRQTDR